MWPIMRLWLGLFAVMGCLLRFTKHVLFKLLSPLENHVVTSWGCEPYKGRKHWLRFAVVSFLIATACFAFISFFTTGRSLTNPRLIGHATSNAMLLVILTTIIYYSFGRGWYAFARGLRLGLIAGLVFLAYMSLYGNSLEKGDSPQAKIIQTKTTQKQYSQPLKKAVKRKAAPDKEMERDMELRLVERREVNMPDRPE